MRCPDVRAKLQSFVDGDLGLGQTALVEHHLAGCGDCRAEMARLQAVVGALESWPLVAEPSQLTARVMAQVKPRPALPAFRLRWSDLAFSLAGASAVFVAMLAWRYLALTELAQLYRPQVYLRLEMLRLEVLLLTYHLAKANGATWGLVLISVALATALAVAVWGQGTLYPGNGRPVPNAPGTARS